MVYNRQNFCGIIERKMAKKYNYNHQQVEEKWLKVWEDNKLFQDTLKNVEIAKTAVFAESGAAANPSATTKLTATTSPVPTTIPSASNKNKMSLLFAFAYPSGSGLHVGHVESKTALDILARYYRMQGKEVFFPVGWDAFGLPAENYAIKTSVHPEKTTTQAIKTFRRQIKRLAISYDWANEISTCHPEYYKWTQWLFLQLYKHGLAYQAKGKVNWCPSCKTVLANEQVVDGKCERCDTLVEQRDLKQWYFKITKYKDELLTGLEQLDWPEPTKMHQRHWIGKKTGIEINYPVEGTQEKISCFTTRPDTNFGATFIVLAPEHQLVQKIISGELPTDSAASEAIKEYAQVASKKSELDRQMEGHTKTGVFTGFYAINELNGKKLPIWISDFVLAGFGTGAVVGVPGHDKRDFEFAQAFDIPIIRVVMANDGDSSPITNLDQVYEDEGIATNSNFLDGLKTPAAIEKMMDYLQEHNMGWRKITYKLRDWLISRQRYWGAPIPIVYDPEGNPHQVKEDHLPWLLPTDVDFKPTGESPLKSSQEFIARTEKLYGKGWRPEFDTMDTFVDSSWYYLRYLDSRNTNEFASQIQLNAWMPYNFYLIGPEHIVLHLLYSRFFTKFLRDTGYLDLPSGEPFIKMRHQGMILGPDGKKMSKSKGNVISPDKIVKQYGADTLRMYEMFMGPLEADKPWDDRAVVGMRRFLDRIYILVEQWLKEEKMEKDQKKSVGQSSSFVNNNPQVSSKIATKNNASDQALARKLHQTIKKVTADIPNLKFNTAIAMMMEFVNDWSKMVQTKSGSFVNKQSQTRSINSATKQTQPDQRLSKDNLLIFVKILAPFAPFLAEELWHKLGRVEQNQTIHQSTWPIYDPDLAREQTITIAIQVNGKLRGQLNVASNIIDNKSQIIEQAKQLESVVRWLEGKQVKKEIYIPGKIVSLVVG